MFIGREEEIQAIERIINQKGYKGAVIYGRRPGKTELLKHSLLNKDVPCIFYQSDFSLWLKSRGSLFILESTIDIFLNQ